jgi:hypothetical protein
MRLTRSRRELFAIAERTWASLNTLQEQTIIARSYPTTRSSIAITSMPVSAALHAATRQMKAAGDISALLGRRLGLRRAGSTNQLDENRARIGYLLKQRLSDDH